MVLQRTLLLLEGKKLRLCSNCVYFHLTEVYARPHILQQNALAFLMACADRWICSEAESE